MQYVLTDRRSYINTIEFKNNVSISNIERLRAFHEEGVVGNFSKREFKYSYDNVIWSPWQTLSTANFVAISFNDHDNFFIHVKYTRTSVISGNINSFSVIYDSQIISIPGPSDSSIINADLLQGEDGAYYLDLTVHYGGINALGLQAENVGTGPGEVYRWPIEYGDSSTPTVIKFRTISGINAATVTQVGDNIVINVDASSGFSTGLNAIGGDVSVYIGKDAQVFLYRTFKSGTGIQLSYQDSSVILVSVAPNIYVTEASLGEHFIWNSSGYLDVSVQSQITDISTSHVWYDTELDPSLQMPNAVGGIPAGTTVFELNGDNMTTILNDLLFPTINPTYVLPSGTFIISPTTSVYEVSANINLDFTTTFNRGQILLNNVFQDYRSGLPHTYDYTGIDLTDVSSSLLLNNQTLFNYKVKLGYQTWSALVYYTSGPQPYDNKGNIYDLPLSAGNVIPYTSRTIEGAYPIFATSVDISVLTKQTLISMSSTPQIGLVREIGGYRQTFDIPVLWPASNLSGILLYNTVANKWEYEMGTNISSLTAWTVSDASHDIQGYIIPYKRYVYNRVERADVSIRLEF